MHSLKFQAVCAPDGFVIDLHGPLEGSRHDGHLLKDSQLLTTMADIPAIRDLGLVIFGDKGYSLSDVVITPFKDGQQGWIWAVRSCVLC